MPGYWGKPEATAEAIENGWLRTGDIGYLDEDGFLFITDRAKDMIIRGGENIYCVEIEQRLVDHPLIADAAVIGVPHPELGEEVKAVVELVDGAELSEAEVQAWVGETLANFKVPAVRRVLDGEAAAQRVGQAVEERAAGRGRSQLRRDDVTPRRALFVAVAVITVAGLVLIIAWNEGPFALTFDDAYYYFGIARNVAEGHGSTFDRLNSTNGYHPLWLALAVPFYAAGLDGMAAVRALLGFQMLMYGAAFLLVADSVGRSVGRWDAVVRRRDSSVGAVVHRRARRRVRVAGRESVRRQGVRERVGVSRRARSWTRCCCGSWSRDAGGGHVVDRRPLVTVAVGGRRVARVGVPGPHRCGAPCGVSRPVGALRGVAAERRRACAGSSSCSPR